MVKFLLVCGLTISVLSSCNKGCDDAQLCITNIGTDTIEYGINQNYYDEVLYSGETDCIYVGEINNGLFTSSSATYTFNSDHGNHGITVDECLEEFEIE